MQQHSYERQYHGEVELDMCLSCQGIWFDDNESLQLAPGSIIELFRLIHERGHENRQPLGTALTCPRCSAALGLEQDLVRSGRFNYFRCGEGHGRFTVFSQFMIEKGFVRQLTPAEIRELSARIGIVRCNGCGAPVDIRTDSACPHCRAAIAILDPEAVDKALATYRLAASKPVARDPAALAEAILSAERQRSLRQRQQPLAPDSDIADLILSGVELVWNVFGD